MHRSGKLGRIGEGRSDNESLSNFHELLAAEDPAGEVFEAWASREAVRRTYELEAEDAGFWLDEAIEAAKASPVAEVRQLDRMFSRWRTEILAPHTTRMSNGPVKGLNPIIKKPKHIAAGFKSFQNYRFASSCPWKYQLAAAQPHTCVRRPQRAVSTARQLTRRV